MDKSEKLTDLANELTKKQAEFYDVLRDNANRFKDFVDYMIHFVENREQEYRRFATALKFIHNHVGSEFEFDISDEELFASNQITVHVYPKDGNMNIWTLKIELDDLSILDDEKDE